MYTYHLGYDAFDGAMAGAAIALSIITLILCVCAIVAYFLAIGALVKAARAKNTQMGNGRLWFIGIFTTPLVLALIVLALPDRGQQAVALPPTPPIV